MSPTQTNPYDQHYQFFRGEDVHVFFQVTPTDDPTGWELGCWVKADLDDDDADALVELEDDDIGRTSGGEIDIDLGSEHTLQPAKTYYYAVWRVTAGSKANLASGTIQLSRSARKGA